MIALPLERLNSLIMHSLLTVISDLGPIAGGMAVAHMFSLLPGTHFFLVPRQLEALWSPTCSDARPFLHLSHPIPGCISTKEAQLQQQEVTKVSVTCSLTTY